MQGGAAFEQVGAELCDAVGQGERGESRVVGKGGGIDGRDGQAAAVVRDFGGKRGFTFERLSRLDGQRRLRVVEITVGDVFEGE